MLLIVLILEHLIWFWTATPHEINVIEEQDCATIQI